MLALVALAACGQFVPADQALSAAGSTPANVEITTRDALADATHLGHYALDGLLATHTGDVSWGGGEARALAWAELAESAEARLALSDTLANLASVDPTLLESRDEKLAFWMNLYNAWTLQGVLDAQTADPSYATVETDDFALFNIAFVQVGGESLSLNQLEHGVMRADPASMDYYFAEQEVLRAQVESWNADLWQGEPTDARLHVGINCASVGCPDLGNGAWQAATLDADLDAAATRFVDHPGKGAGADGVSQLFRWFVADFEGSHGGVQSFVSRFRTGGDDAVDYDATLEYDWSLNEL
jgi:hypothetical protein